MDLHAEVSKVLELLRYSKDLKQGTPMVKSTLELINSVPPDLPIVQADKHRVSQLLYNLIGNACKFTAVGNVTVRARIFDNNAGGRTLRISVEDTGIGVPAHRVESIFEDFVQADDSVARQYAGTGLGLSICRMLAEKHGGRIWCESVEGVGSQFHIEIPTEAPSSQKGSVEGPSSVRGGSAISRKASSLSVSAVADHDQQRVGQEPPSKVKAWDKSDNQTKTILSVDDDTVNQVTAPHRVYVCMTVCASSATRSAPKSSRYR